MYTFLKALDEKRSNPWCSRCQTLVWKKSSRRATSAHWGNFWVALLRGTIPVQIKVWWSDHPWSVLYSSRAFRRYIILGVTPLNSKFQKFDNVRPLPGVTQQVAFSAHRLLAEDFMLLAVSLAMEGVVSKKQAFQKHRPHPTTEAFCQSEPGNQIKAAQHRLPHGPVVADQPL